MKAVDLNIPCSQESMEDVQRHMAKIAPSLEATSADLVNLPVGSPESRAAARAAAGRRKQHYDAPTFGLQFFLAEEKGDTPFSREDVRELLNKLVPVG